MAQDRELGHREDPSPAAEEVMPEPMHEAHREAGEGLQGWEDGAQTCGGRDHCAKPPKTMRFCWS